MPVGLKSGYEIAPDQPLPAYDSPPARAYAAHATNGPGERLYALICDPATLPRRPVLRSLKRLRHPGMLSVIDLEVVDWPAEDGRRLAIVLERPAGEPLMSPESTAERPMSPNLVMHTVMVPIVSALTALGELGIAHGSIRPDNVYAAGNSVKLGQGYANPTGLNQPVLFQTIERSMAIAAGRGGCQPGDDMYALGATLLVLLRGHHPLAGAGDDEILRRKMELGSYHALVGSEKVPYKFLEPLRGLLTDDPDCRWTVENLDLWITVQQQATRHPMPKPRAQRPFVFRGKQYVDCRILAHDLWCHWHDAGDVVLGKEFASWVTHSLGDQKLAEKFLEVVPPDDRGATDPVLRDRSVARVLMALDNLAPIRVKELRVALDGFGPLLASWIDDEQKIAVLREAITAKMPLAWFGMQTEPRSDQLRQLQSFEKVAPLMERDEFGAGMERCLYELNPDLPCLSPLIRRYYVSQAAEILPALEQAAQRNDRGQLLIDRHLAAFIAARTKTNFATLFRDVARGPRTTEGALATLSILVKLLNRQASLSMPALAGWLGELMTSVVKSYRKLDRRTRVEEGLRAATQSGDLTALLQLLDDSNALDRDAQEYEEATVVYTRNAAEIAMLTDDQGHRALTAQRAGARLAAVIGMGLAGVVVLVNFIAYVI